jgi:hypothetical protein
MRTKHVSVAVAALGMLCFGGPYAVAGAHTWDVWELFSNASGTIQFIELKETGGGNFERGIGGLTVTSNTSTFTIPSNLTSDTGFKHLLFATASFASLPGAPTPNYIIPGNFFSVTADTIRYNPYDFWSFTAGQLPTDGINSRQRDCLSCPNSPTNFAGQTGSVNANPPPAAPPGVPDGAAGSTPMTVVANDASATSLSISWDTATCSDATSHHIIYGQKSDLPAAPGGVFGLTGAVCGIGGTSPFLWSPAPDATDGLGLIWWLVVVNDGASTEGPWGNGSDGLERIGPGPGGSSGLCGITTKNITNVCGH